LFRTFSFGVVIGAIAAVALLYFVPAVDHVRERSVTTVQANGGNSESFHINLPTDRILAGTAERPGAVPEALEWPEYEFLSGTQTELFKVRNVEEKVIGVASRIAGGNETPFVEWVIHLPARGTLYLLLGETADDTQVSVGEFRAGTREFATMTGMASEQFVAYDTVTSNDVSGRIEITTSLVSAPVDFDDIEGEEL